MLKCSTGYHWVVVCSSNFPIIDSLAEGYMYIFCNWEGSMQTLTIRIARHGLYAHPADSSMAWCAKRGERVKLLIL